MNLEKKVIYGKPKDCYFLPFNINEAIAWKGTAMSRKQLFKEGLVAKITVEAVPVSECRKLE